ncbi:MAG: AzlC family ABC transporter permease [Haloferacaceae archaeon]
MSDASSPLADARSGAVQSIPILLGIAPFGLVVGVAAVEAGLSPLQTVAASVVIFAGASQLAAVDLFGRGAAPAVIVLTAAVINVRMVMYSASIAPRFRAYPRRLRPLCSYLLTDPVYALTVAPDERPSVHYYLGLAGTVWAVWQVATVAGIALGRGLPPSWGLSFAVPLVFLSLLVPEVTDRPHLVAALVGGTVAVLGGGLPFNLGLVAGALTGVGAGLATERTLDGRRASGDEAGAAEEP